MFENIIGNDDIKETLIKSLNNGKTSHSYLFIGIEGIGKKLVAEEFSKALLCSNKNEYCDKCKACIEFNSKNNPDFMVVEPEGNSIKVDIIRNLQKKIQEKPIISEKKVYIINDAEKMTKEAQNCLLKTLEEPPEYAVIILIGSDENAFLTTIKSRCMIIHFQSLQNKQIKKYIENNFGMINLNDDILNISQGSIGKWIQLKDRLDDYKILEQIIHSLKLKNIIDITKMSENLYKSKEEIYDMLDYMNIVLIKAAKTDSIYTNCIKIVENTKRKLRLNANYDMCIDDMLFNIWEEVN